MIRKTRALAERAWEKVDQRGALDCWPWTGSRNGAGYGKIGSGRRYGPILYAHRVVWELVHGPIPDGLVIDHLCRNKACCNPSHLQPVPPKINFLRSAAANAHAFLEARCTRGHDLTADNTYVIRSEKRGTLAYCRRCRLDAGTRSRAAHPRPRRPQRLGSQHHSSKFTDRDVLIVRQRHSEGVTIAALSREYGVAWNAIGSIVNRRTWKHLS